MRGDPTQRAATAKILDLLPVECPRGVVPRTGRGTMVKAGDGSYVVQIEKIYNPSLIIPGYAKASSGDDVTLQDLGCSKVVVPISLLREHHALYIPSSSNDATGKTQPAPSSENNTPAQGTFQIAREMCSLGGDYDLYVHLHL